MYVFFFNDTATTEIYTLSLHDALPISGSGVPGGHRWQRHPAARPGSSADRKSTRLNSSHLVISYAVFCLKKKKNDTNQASYTEICICPLTIYPSTVVYICSWSLRDDSM